MGNLRHYIQRIKEGDSYFDSTFKLSAVVTEMGTVHLALSVLFIVADRLHMCVYHFGAFVLYIFLLYMVKKQRHVLCLAISSVEVILSVVLSTLLVGYDTGFYMYCFTMIPGIFYMVLSWDVFKKKEIVSIACSLLFMGVFITNYFVGKNIAPISPLEDVWCSVITVFNIVVCIMAMTEFLVLINWDVMYKSETLTSKNEELDEMANRDTLTKLYNRRFLNDKLVEKMEGLSKSGQIFGIIMGDIDDFKKVNDTFGHDVGDVVLIEVSKALLASTREDDFVARWGGEEFLIVINGNKQITAAVAERMRTMVSEINIPMPDDKNISVTMTFGVCESIPGYSIEKIIEIADTNLYKGKQNGKNKVVF